MQLTRCMCGATFNQSVVSECPYCSRGVGDVVATITEKLRVKKCGGCKKRQRTLNRRTPNWLRKWLSALMTWRIASATSVMSRSPIWRG